MQPRFGASGSGCKEGQVRREVHVQRQGAVPSSASAAVSVVVRLVHLAVAAWQGCATLLSSQCLQEWCAPSLAPLPPPPPPAPPPSPQGQPLGYTRRPLALTIPAVRMVMRLVHLAVALSSTGSPTLQHLHAHLLSCFLLVVSTINWLVDGPADCCMLTGLCRPSVSRSPARSAMQSAPPQATFFSGLQLGHAVGPSGCHIGRGLHAPAPLKTSSRMMHYPVYGRPSLLKQSQACCRA